MIEKRNSKMECCSRKKAIDECEVMVADILADTRIAPRERAILYDKLRKGFDELRNIFFTIEHCNAQNENSNCKTERKEVVNGYQE